MKELEKVKYWSHTFIYTSYLVTCKKPEANIYNEFPTCLLEALRNVNSFMTWDSHPDHNNFAS